jgi:hypothetical protein
VAGAFLGVMTWWVSEAPDTDPARVDEAFQRVAGGVWALPSP